MRKLTTASLKTHVLAMLGHSDITVELEDADWTAIYDRTLFKYNKYRPKIMDYALTFVLNRQDYQLEPNKVGRGVFDIVFAKELGDAYFALFDSSYYPLNFGGQRLDTANFLEWKTFHQAQKQVYGVEKDWEYNPDTNILTVYPPPAKSETVNLVTAHDRYFFEVQIGSGDGNKTEFPDLQLTDLDGFPIKNLIPGFQISAPLEKFRDNRNGTLTSNKGGSGTVDYTTGTVSITFNSAPVADAAIMAEIFEVRENDYDWYQDYATALAKIIVGYKRRRFSNIPGQQAPITLDTAIKDDGGEELKELEDSAKLWLVQFLIPRAI